MKKGLIIFIVVALIAVVVFLIIKNRKKVYVSEVPKKGHDPTKFGYDPYQTYMKLP